MYEKGECVTRVYTNSMVLVSITSTWCEVLRFIYKDRFTRHTAPQYILVNVDCKMSNAIHEICKEIDADF